MLYESFKYCPRGPPQATHASAWRKWRKWVPKLIRMMGFRLNFWNFPGSPRVACMGVLWCILMSWSSGKFSGMILNDFWKLQKIMIFLKNFRRNDDLCPSFSICLLHRFEVCDVESPSKQCFLIWKKYLSPNERLDFQESMFSNPKLFKMSQFFAVLTSSSLTPYYSYRAFALQEICSTSHLNTSKIMYLSLLYPQEPSVWS